VQGSRIIDRLARIPRAQRLLLYGVFYVILAVAYWALLYLPKSSDLSDLGRQQATLIEQLRQVNDRAKNLEKFEAEVNALMYDLQQALKELPNDREIPGLLKGISTLGKKVGLEVRKFQPLPEVPREFVAEVPVALEVEGSYHEVAMFFDRLSKMNRIVYVQDIEMGDPKERGGKVYLKVSGDAVTFRFLTEDELKASASKEKEGKKGKRRPAAGGND